MAVSISLTVLTNRPYPTPPAKQPCIANRRDAEVVAVLVRAWLVASVAVLVRAWRVASVAVLVRARRVASGVTNDHDKSPFTNHNAHLRGKSFLGVVAPC